MEIALWDQAPSQLTWEEKVAFIAYRFMDLEQVEAPVEHRFEPGFYVRKFRLPADTFFIGRKHNHGHAVALLEGECVLVTPGEKRVFTAPYSIETVAGFHAVVYTITDIVAESWHRNPEESRHIPALELDAFEPAHELFDRGRIIQERLTWSAQQLV